MKTTRLSTDLGDPRLMTLLKREAEETDSTVKDVLTHALEAYFLHRLETRALMKMSDEVFSDWDHALDAEYDQINPKK